MPSNNSFDWGSNPSRFVRFDSARAEDVNSALDQVTSGFDTVEGLTDAAIKLPNGETATVLPAPASRAGKVLSFDSSGQPTTAHLTTGLGDVSTSGTVSADERIAVFDGTTGDLIKDGGKKISELGLTSVAVTTTNTSTINTLELCAATSAIVRTIPTGTVVGDSIGYKDNGQMFATYSLTITPPSGDRIEDLAIDETLVVTTNYLAFTLKKVATGLWRIF